jgi:hypothetical protein
MITAEEARVLSAYHKANHEARFIEENKKHIEGRIANSIIGGVNYIFLQYKLRTPELLSWLESLGYKVEYQNENSTSESTTISW